MKTIKELNQKMWYRTMKVLAFIPILYAITGILYTIILFIIPNLFGNERAELIVIGV